MRSLIRLLHCLLAVPLLGLALLAQEEAAIRFLDKADVLPDVRRQQELRETGPWSIFRADHPGWSCEFTEATGYPRRAFGPPLEVDGGSPEERAMVFLTQHLSGFGLPVSELVHRTTTRSPRAVFVHFEQWRSGLEVLGARAMVKFDALGRVIGFMTDLRPLMELSLAPTVSEHVAMEVAGAGLEGILTVAHEGLAILPVPGARNTEDRLVHQVLVRTRHGDREGRYRCLVDANDGRLWYRDNEVKDLSACMGQHDGGSSAEVAVSASVRANGPLQPSQVVPFADLVVQVAGQTFHTDENGYFAPGAIAPVEVQIPLRGRWAHVIGSGGTPTLTTTLQDGLNTVDLGEVASMRERTAYHAVGRIHGYMQERLPGFTGMDIVLPTRIDVTGGSCNAFYDGSSISFFPAGNGCRSFALLPDVVFHEYAHGINDKLYQSLGASFINSAMNEAYADLWAISLSGNPRFGTGFQVSNDSLSIRRYDEGPRVYPLDLVGQVHADGMIICGAWLHLAELLGSTEAMFELFVATLPGLQALAWNGQEGAAYRDVLVDALQADDDDGDITNGTPNGDLIIAAFARHGITLLSSATLAHEPVELMEAEQPTVVSVLADIQFPFGEYLEGIELRYRQSNTTSWEVVSMDPSGWNMWSAALPPMPAGTVVEYHFALRDIYGEEGAVLPRGASAEEPNVPFNVLVGLELRATEDADLLHELGVWTAGLPTDNATAGQWEQNVPVPSFSGNNGTGTMVQPGSQTTPGGEFCWVTANATSANAPMGEADVDGGVTTLISGPIDLSFQQAPVITYERWYVNDPPGGSNPRDDRWQVQVSADGGATWVGVEDTRVSDRSWRRFAFRVQDHVPLTAEFRMRFMASDSLRPGALQEGGSIVEAAVDDIRLWDLPDISTSIDQRLDVSGLTIYPNPTTDLLTVRFDLDLQGDVDAEVMDLSGRRMLLRRLRSEDGAAELDIRGLAAGNYMLRLSWGGGSTDRRFHIMR